MRIDINKEYFTTSGFVVIFNKDKIEKLIMENSKPIALEERARKIHREDYPETLYAYGLALHINSSNSFMMHEITWEKETGCVVRHSMQASFKYDGICRDSISDLNIVDEYNMSAYVKYRNNKLDELMKTKRTIKDKITNFVLKGGEINKQAAIAFDSTLEEFAEINDSITRFYKNELSFLKLYKRDNPDEIVYLDIIAKVLERHLQDEEPKAYSNVDVAKQVAMLKIHGFDFY